MGGEKKRGVDVKAARKTARRIMRDAPRPGAVAMMGLGGLVGGVMQGAAGLDVARALRELTAEVRTTGMVMAYASSPWMDRSGEVLALREVFQQHDKAADHAAAAEVLVGQAAAHARAAREAQEERRNVVAGGEADVVLGVMGARYRSWAETCTISAAAHVTQQRAAEAAAADAPLVAAGQPV